MDKKTEFWTKRCVKCDQIKFINGFHLNSKTKDGHSPWCKSCMYEAKVEWRKDNLERSREINREWSRKNFNYCRQNAIIQNEKKRQVWKDILKKDKCEICGYDKCSYALDFHHIDESKKSFNISVFRSRHSPNEENKQKMLEEIKKCEILCANCHREKHARKIYN